MKVLPPEADAALTPLRQAMLATSSAAAETIRSAASEQAAALIAQARHEADSIRERARADGEAVARAHAELASARARRRAHDTILAAQNSLRQALLVEVGNAATALRDDPRYPALRAGLQDYALGILGPDAQVRESPAGGIIAEAGSRRLDLTLPVLALTTVAAMPQQVSSLWTDETGQHDGA